MVLGYVCLCLRPAMSLGCYRGWTGGQYGRGASSLSRYGTRFSQSGIVSVPTWGGSYSARTGSVSVSASLVASSISPQLWRRRDSYASRASRSEPVTAGYSESGTLRLASPTVRFPLVRTRGGRLLRQPIL
ncbi:uncharacterized protein B0I36DRAFT_337014, partial [Microdochium trichocladiopsis]